MSHSHSHHHDHGHGHGHGHDHAAEARALASNPANRSSLTLALAIAVVFMIIEIIGGIRTNSVALLSDAVHMAADCSAYLIALIAARLAMRPASATRTFGWARTEILAALVNGALLVVLSVGLAVEATRRLTNPEPVQGGGMAFVALLGLAANIGVVAVLLRADRTNLNIRGALLHGVTDALSSLYVVGAGVLVAITGVNRIDSGATYLIAALTLWGAWRLIRDSVDVLLDIAPRDVSTDAIATAMLSAMGVTHVHDLHVWQITPGNTALSAHVRVASNGDRDAALQQIEQVLQEHFNITHSTLQITVERASSDLSAVDMMDPADAIAWATDHLAQTYPGLSRSVISAAAGAAALQFGATRVSPVALSMRARQHLGTTTDQA